MVAKPPADSPNLDPCPGAPKASVRLSWPAYVRTWPHASIGPECALVRRSSARELVLSPFPWCLVSLLAWMGGGAEFPKECSSMGGARTGKDRGALCQCLPAGLALIA
eukprot:10734669-Heterocapsa_arctica.AAC.1